MSTMKKIGKSFGFLSICAIALFLAVGIVFAGNIDTTATLEVNKSVSKTASSMNVDFLTSINASYLSSTKPTVNTKAQSKVLLIWNVGVNSNTQVLETGTTYIIYYNATKSYPTKVTWKNKTSGSKITARFRAYDC